MSLLETSGSHLGVILSPAPAPGDFWKLETFLVVVTAGGESAPGIWWVEARDAAKPPKTHRTAPQQRAVWPTGQ